MRVLHLLASNGWGGAERVACTLHRLAQQHGHVSSIDGPAYPQLLDGVENDTGMRLPSAAFERFHFPWALAARMRKERFAPDVVHAHLATPGLAGAAWLVAGRTPMVITMHLLRRIPRWPKDYFAPVQSETVLAAIARKQPRTRAFVTVSAADKEYFESVVQGVHADLVVNAPPLPPLRAAVPRGLPRPPGVLQLLSVGRLNEQKGFDRMLRALSTPTLRAHEWHWTIAGEGEEHARLEAMVVAEGLEGRVTLAGSVPAHSLYDQVDLVLCPSRFEGMPLVVLEALAAHTPVVASSIPPHVELLGTVADSLLPADEREWPGALERLLRDPAAISGLKSAQSSASPGDPRERFWGEYFRLYERVVTG